jgi:hypothetical protein
VRAGYARPGAPQHPIFQPPDAPDAGLCQRGAVPRPGGRGDGRRRGGVFRQRLQRRPPRRSAPGAGGVPEGLRPGAVQRAGVPAAHQLRDVHLGFRGRGAAGAAPGGKGVLRHLPGRLPGGGPAAGAGGAAEKAPGADAGGYRQRPSVLLCALPHPGRQLPGPRAVLRRIPPHGGLRAAGGALPEASPTTTSIPRTAPPCPGSSRTT